MDIKVAIFEDNKHLREGLSLIINGTTGLSCTGVFADCNDWEYAIRKSDPDLVLMDIEMPGMKGTEGVKKIKSKFPHIHILMQTVFGDDDNIFEAICAGASGYILKDTAPAQIIQAIFDVRDGGAPMSPSVARRVLELFQKNIFPKGENTYSLSEKEKEVLTHLVAGKSFKMIAAECNITYETVRTHIKHIYEKLHVHSSTEAVSKAMKERIV